MMILALSAAFVGFIHSLAPGHWLPVVLMVKTRRWSMRKAALGALTAAGGHILVSLGMGLATVFIGNELFRHNLTEIEEHAGWVLVIFGIAYAAYSRKKHSRCHGHEHHGPAPDSRAPFIFLFSLGLSPCFAVLPVFLASVGIGMIPMFFVMLSFSLGVIAALVGGSLLVSQGLIKLDHPILEHHGDAITGIGVALMGVLLVLMPHHH